MSAQAATTASPRIEDDKSIMYVLWSVMAIFLTLCAILSADMYQTYQARMVLEVPAMGAKALYKERQYSFQTIIGVAREVGETRAPGRYIAALNIWRAAVAEDAPASPEAAWLTKLRQAERAKAQALLAEQSVTLDMLSTLTQKLSRISPQLSKQEEELLDKLTSTSLLQLAYTKSDTTEYITAKLITLGAPKEALNQMGFW